MRLIVSSPTENPIVFAVTKIENVQPLGMQKLTIYQKAFNPHTDYIEKDSNGKIIGMWTNYFDSNIKPINPSLPPIAQSSVYGKIVASTYNIKIGGSYKLLILKIYDSSDNETTEKYSNAIFDWHCNITNENEYIDLTNDVSWKDIEIFNQKKIKFNDDRKYLNKILNVTCVVTIDGSDEKIESSAQFELII